MRRRRPVLGIVSGIVFGLFSALSLALFGLVALDSIVLTVVLVAGIALGIVIGFTAPLGRGRDRTAGEVTPESEQGQVEPSPDQQADDPSREAASPPTAPPEG